MATQAATAISSDSYAVYREEVMQRVEEATGLLPAEVNDLLHAHDVTVRANFLGEILPATTAAKVMEDEQEVGSLYHLYE
jgi:hypothetical protein